MSVDSQRAKELFMALADKVPREVWDDRIRDACQGNEELEQRVRALLQAHAEPKSFLDMPPLATDAEEEGARSIVEGPGSQIGPYQILDLLGEGGMGSVFLAQQQHPVQRRVALKVIKPGMDSRPVIARFEAERQALAMMDHPHVAKVLDAGTTEGGRPYFVMELVEGIPINEFCDQQRLTPQQRLQLFVHVCQAVQHAHQKGIIHRDLKPSNVLVTLCDDEPVPKVIDFGVAKATSRPLSEKTLFTQHGQLVGTPEYMSPEQAQLHHLDIDTRSDIYSLGVMLYQLLSGETPFDRERLRSSAFDEIIRIIREEEPPRPSARLDSSESLPSIAANRRTEPHRLSVLLRGELDWIVMKAMDKDRSRRYETALGLSQDIQRYLHSEPVEARPASTLYRFRKLVRRNKTAFALWALVAATLLAGTGLATWQAVRASRERNRAVRRAARAAAAGTNPGGGRRVQKAASLPTKQSDGEVAFLLAMAYWHLGKTNEANEYFGQGVARLSDVESPSETLRELHEQARQLLESGGGSQNTQDEQPKTGEDGG